MSLNEALGIIGGNMVRDVELKTLDSGTTVGDFAVAVNKSYKKKDGEKVDKTSFFNCVAFGKTAEFIEQYFKKGDAIYLHTDIEQETWEDKEGVKRSAVKFKVKEAKFSGGPKKDAATPKDAPANAPAKTTKGKKGSQEQETVASNGDDQEIPF